MALRDIELFLREAITRFDPNADVSSGSAADSQIIQPLLRRIGTDPFSVDVGTFIRQRVGEVYPDIVNSTGFIDLFVKPLTLLLDPIVRENDRISNLSFKDPAVLTTEEAESLGGNFFVSRERGDLARGIGRIYFAQPQTINVYPINYTTARTGVRFFPVNKQSIRADEMLANVEDSAYYFDINVVAEKPGTEYNIEPGLLVAISGIPAAVSVTNKRRFRFGQPEESTIQYVNRIGQDITERSAVTEPGANAIISAAFPDVSRTAIVGMGDSEMRRDILTGGGFGPIIMSGSAGSTVYDQESRPRTRRFRALDADVDFTKIIGPRGPVKGTFYLCVVNAYGSSPPFIRDLKVIRVWDAVTVDVEEQLFEPNLNTLFWSLRRNTLTISSIPGGIAYPGPNGTLEYTDQEVHIGGMSDIYVRGSDVDTSTLTLSAITDDRPELFGIKAQVVSLDGDVQLTDFVQGTNYAQGDRAYELFEAAARDGFSLQILSGPTGVPGVYRVTGTIQTLGSAPILTVTPAPTAFSGFFRWKLVDTIDMNLVDPGDALVSGSDMQSQQNSNIFAVSSGIDLSAFGVGEGTTLRILNGPDAGDFVLKSVNAPFFSTVTTDRPATATSSDLQYEFITLNAQGGIDLPLLRIKQIDLLDPSGQPVGSKVPYANPIDCQTTSFTNPARGVKSETKDATLGLVSRSLPSLTCADVDGLSLSFQFENVPGLNTFVFSPGSTPDPYTIDTLVTDLNTHFGATLVYALTYSTDPNSVSSVFGIAPNNGFDISLVGGTARSLLFGDANFIGSTRDIRSDNIKSSGGWETYLPLDTNYDVAHVVEGSQVGFYNELTVDNTQLGRLITKHLFFPELQRYVKLGSRSIGKARIYFLDPTSFSVTPQTVFTATQEDGQELRYFGDNKLDYTIIPAQPNGSKPKDGVVVGSTNYLSSASTDFIKYLVHPGDVCVIDYTPIVGSVALGDPVLNVVGLELILSVDNKVDRIITFTNDKLSIGAANITRQGLVGQINALVGLAVCSLDGSNHLVFDGTVSIVVRATGSANTALGFSTTEDTNNFSPIKGTYEIIGVLQNAISFDLTSIGGVFPPGPFNDVQFKVIKRNLQRICTTQMSLNLAEAGLYYFDVELVSEGTGDQYNINAGTQLKLKGFKSDGFFLTTDNIELAFSPAETVRLHVSRTIQEVGVNDDPNSVTQISGQNLLLTYETSSTIANLQNYLLSETERVVCENPLTKHMVPHFIRFDMSYTSGPSTSDLLEKFIEYINERNPVDLLQAGDFIKMTRDLGALSVNAPFDMIALVYDVDRSVWSQRNQKALGITRLAAFIPEQIRLSRSTS